MKLNCDLGESFGIWPMGLDEQAMLYIDQANIACGFHAGDPQVIYKTLNLAKQHQVMIGAHPSYPDLAGFGRRSMNCSDEEIYTMLHYQIAALDGMAKSQQMQLQYVKPHGALYNDMMRQPRVMQVIIKAISDYHHPLALMLQATPELPNHKALAVKQGVTIWSEAFADRGYADDGKLLPRDKTGAVLNHQQILKQVKQLRETGCVTSINGQLIALNPDSLCVHGDNAESISALAEIKALLA